MGVAQRDPAEVARTLEAWIGALPDVDRVRVRAVETPSSTGWSNETILFVADLEQDGVVETRELVARVAPSGYRVFPDDTFARQFAVMRAVAARSSVPRGNGRPMSSSRS